MTFCVSQMPKRTNTTHTLHLCLSLPFLFRYADHPFSLESNTFEAFRVSARLLECECVCIHWHYYSTWPLACLRIQRQYRKYRKRKYFVHFARWIKRKFFIKSEKCNLFSNAHVCFLAFMLFECIWMGFSWSYFVMYAFPWCLCRLMPLFSFAQHCNILCDEVCGPSAFFSVHYTFNFFISAHETVQRIQRIKSIQFFSPIVACAFFFSFFYFFLYFRSIYPRDTDYVSPFHITLNNVCTKLKLEKIPFSLSLFCWERRAKNMILFFL